MRVYADTLKSSPEATIRVHALLLSLTETINASETNPDISAISENDERALRYPLYTLPSELPPLEIHVSGQNGASPLSNQINYSLKSVAGCRECIAAADSAHSGSSSPGTHNKRKKRRRVSLGSVQGNLPNTRGPKAAGVVPKAKGKQSDKFSQEGRGQGAEPGMSGRVPAQPLLIAYTTHYRHRQ
jgi:hypothetical protein